MSVLAHTHYTTAGDIRDQKGTYVLRIEMVVLEVGQIDHLFRGVLVVVSRTRVIVHRLLLLVIIAGMRTVIDEIHQVCDVGVVLDLGHFGAQFFVGFERDEVRSPIEKDFADQRPVLFHFAPCGRVEQKETGPESELSEFVGHVFVHQGSKVEDDQRRAHVKDEPIGVLLLRRVVDFRRDEQIGPHDVLNSNKGECLNDRSDDQTNLFERFVVEEF